MKKLITLALIASGSLFGMSDVPSMADSASLLAAGMAAYPFYAIGFWLEQTNCERQVKAEIEKFKSNPNEYMGGQNQVITNLCLNQSYSARLEFTYHKELNSFAIKTIAGSTQGLKKNYEVFTIA